jgi:hypothetical protein
MVHFGGQQYMAMTILGVRPYYKQVHRIKEII